MSHCGTGRLGCAYQPALEGTHTTAEGGGFARTMDLLMPLGFALGINHTQGGSLSDPWAEDEIQQSSVPLGVLA